MSNKLTTELFLQKVELIHGNRYSYDRVDVKGACINIIIGCISHGNFEQQPRMHLSGQGCPTCAREYTGICNSLKFAEFINRASEIHNNKYSYIEETYVNATTTICICCPVHKEFYQTPVSHLSGRGCSRCGLLSRAVKRTFTNEDYINKAIAVHNNKYSYENIVYIKSCNKIEIFCKVHGNFWQIAADHINGAGCPKCCSIGTSKGEKEWLDFLNIPLEFRNQRIIIGERFYKPDAVDTENKIVYEYNGDYWHGNPARFNLADINLSNGQLFGDLYLKTISKENIFKKAGYIVISIWESEWNKYKDNI